MIESNMLFSQERMQNYQNDDQKHISRSFDLWSQNNTNIDEFLKGSSHSFLNNDNSFKESTSTNIKPEISCDNPLEMDSIAESKQLELEDLEVKKSFTTNTERFENSNLTYKEMQSRNDERHLSRDNSSICNFKSMDVTHNSWSSSAMEEFDKIDERQQYCNSPIRLRK